MLQYVIKIFTPQRWHLVTKMIAIHMHIICELYTELGSSCSIWDVRNILVMSEWSATKAHNAVKWIVFNRLQAHNFSLACEGVPKNMIGSSQFCRQVMREVHVDCNHFCYRLFLSLWIEILITFFSILKVKEKGRSGAGPVAKGNTGAKRYMGWYEQNVWAQYHLVRAMGEGTGW